MITLQVHNETYEGKNKYMIYIAKSTSVSNVCSLYMLRGHDCVFCSIALLLTYMCLRMTSSTRSSKKPKTKGPRSTAQVLPTLPPLHLRRFTGSNVTGHPQQVTQHHTACLWAPHSSTCWDWNFPPVRHTEPAARTIQIQAALLPPQHYSACSMAIMAATATSCILGHTWIPHADCNLSRGPGSAWPCLPYAKLYTDRYHILHRASNLILHSSFPMLSQALLPATGPHCIGSF